MMKRLFLALCLDESGSTPVEYALIAAVISIGIVGGATLIGTKLKGYFNNVSGNLG